MLLSPSANRAKSWTCEHCKNWEIKDPKFCMRCFWAHPEDYDHVAGKPEKMVSIVFSGNEIDNYNKLIRLAGEQTAQETIKQILHEHLK
ncbi:MAG TPA: HNH nuclease [Firmicutes bacterium]|nr:HNH nuclease [Bacillota bacterium]